MHLVSDTSASATYVYCVVKAALRERRTGSAAAGAPKLGRVPNGLSGAGRPRVLDAGDGYYLLVASAPLALYDAAAIDPKLRDLEWVSQRAAEHEAVVEHAANLGTVVPMKLFTLFTNDDRAVGHVRKMKRSLDRVADRIEGCEEWGLRILFDQARAARAAAEARSKKHAAPSGRGKLEGPSRSNESMSGTSFLLRKKTIDEERRRAGARGGAAVEELYERVAKSVRIAQRREAPNRELAGQVVLDAVFLVPHESVKKLKSIVRASAKSLVDEGFDLVLSGPWPAYSFIGAR
jgi:hypothetical protein